MLENSFSWISTDKPFASTKSYFLSNLKISLGGIIVRARKIPHFTGLGMRNLPRKP
jgi:hypothetical protein